MSSRSGKKLDEMDSVLDLGCFPAPVLAGALVNVAFTVFLTRSLRRRGVTGGGVSGLAMWVALLLAANLAPVVLLRRTSDMEAPKPEIEEMDFWGDQHRFPRWVYVAASGNLALWTTVAWYTAKRPGLLKVVAVALLGSASPKIAVRMMER